MADPNDPSLGAQVSRVRHDLRNAEQRLIGIETRLDEAERARALRQPQIEEMRRELDVLKEQYRALKEDVEDLETVPEKKNASWIGWAGVIVALLALVAALLK